MQLVAVGAGVPRCAAAGTRAGSRGACACAAAVARTPRGSESSSGVDVVSSPETVRTDERIDAKRESENEGRRKETCQSVILVRTCQRTSRL